MTAQTEQPLAPNGQGGLYEPCEECGALLDPQQRYCVQCAARRGNGANPSSRYFASMSKRARRPPRQRPAKAGTGSRAAAVAFFALLPIAVALGVVVGRTDSDGNDDALLRALREGEVPAVAGAGASPAASAVASGPKAKGAKQGKAAAGGKVVAQTDNGSVHQVTGFEPTKEKTEEDTKIVESNVKQAGATYIKAQQNLPDVVVVGGDPESAPPMPSGKGQP